jgi:hypothetical protein
MTSRRLILLNIGVMWNNYGRTRYLKDKAHRPIVISRFFIGYNIVRNTM